MPINNRNTVTNDGAKSKKTTKVDNYTNPANDGMNLSGVDNIKNAVGNVKEKAPVSKPVIQNNEKGKDFVTSSVSKAGEKMIEDASKQSSKEVRTKINNVIYPLQQKISEGIKTITQPIVEANKQYRDNLQAERQERFIRQNQKNFENEEKVRLEKVNSISQDDFNKFYNTDGSQIDYAPKITELEGQLATFKDVSTNSMDEMQKASADNEVARIQDELNYYNDIIDKRNAYEETAIIQQMRENEDGESELSFRRQLLHKDDNLLERFGMAGAHLLTTTINEVPMAVDQIKLTGSTLMAKDNLNRLEVLHANGEIDNDVYVEALQYWQDELDNYREQYNDSISQEIQKVANQYGANAFYNASDIEQFALQAGESTAQFLLHFAIGAGLTGATTSLTGEAFRETAGMVATSTMSTMSATSKMDQLLQEGYDVETAMANGLFTGLVSYAVEKVGMDRFVDMLGTDISVNILGDVLIKNAQSGVSEGLEEVVEGLIDPLVDSVTLGTDYVVNGNELKMEFLLGGASGLLMAVGSNVGSVARSQIEVNQYIQARRQARADVLGQTGQLTVEDRHQYNMLQSEVDALRNYLPSMTENQVNVARELITKGENALNKFALKSQTMGVIFSSDFVTQPTFQESSNAIYEAIVPDFNKEVQSTLQIDEIQNRVNESLDNVIAGENATIEATQQVLNDNGYNISAEVFTRLNPEAQNQALVALDTARALGINADITVDLPEGVNGYVQDGFIIVDGNKRPILSTLSHELTHGTENSKYYQTLKKLVKKAYGSDWKNAVNQKIEDYKAVQDLDFEGAEKEVVARYVEDKLGDEKFMEDLIKYNYSLASKIWQDLKAIGNNDEIAQIRNAFEKAFSDNYRQDAEQFSFTKEADFNQLDYDLAPDLSNKLDQLERQEIGTNLALNNAKGVGTTYWNGKQYTVYADGTGNFKVLDYNEIDDRRTVGTISRGNARSINTRTLANNGGFSNDNGRTFYENDEVVEGEQNDRLRLDGSSKSSNQNQRGNERSNPLTDEEYWEMAKRYMEKNGKGRFSFDTYNSNYDNEGKPLVKEMSNYLNTSIGDRVNPYDPNSPHIRWKHGTDNATFTEYNNANQRTRGSDYTNKSRAIYLTSSPKVASSYSGTDRIADPYNVQEKPKNFKQLRELLNRNDTDVAKVKGTRNSSYILFGDGLEELLNESYTIDDAFDLIDAMETAYRNIETGEFIDNDYAYKNDIDVDDETKWEEINGIFTYENTFKGLLNYVWEYAFPNRGNYELYAKSENPLIIDAEGKRWNQLPSLGTVVEQEAEPYMPEYNGFKTPEDINRYLEDAGKLDRVLTKEQFMNLIDEEYSTRDAEDIKNHFKDTNYFMVTMSNPENEDLFGLRPAPLLNRTTSRENTLEEFINDAIFRRILPRKVERIERELNTTRDYEQYALDNGYDSIRYMNIVDIGGYRGTDEPSEILVVFNPEQVKSVNNQNPTNSPDIRYSVDPSQNSKLEDAISNLPDVSIDDDTRDMLNIIDEQITFNGKPTPQMVDTLKQRLYESTFYTIEGNDEVTKKDINRFLRENPLKWRAVKGDTRDGLIDFQRDHPGFKFASSGGMDWDVIAMEFTERFPGSIDPNNLNSAVDFINAVQDYRDQVDELNKGLLVDPGNYEEYSDKFDKLMDDYIKENQIKLSQPREMSEDKLRSIERQRELFRKSVRDWVRDYDVLREKYDLFDDEAFDDAIADVYIEGEVTPQTEQKLKDSVIRNDFMGEYTGDRINTFVEEFIDDSVRYYVLESEYNVNQKYRDTIARTANIINQAKTDLYEQDYERSETAKNINEMAKENRAREYDAVYEDVQYVVDNTTSNKVNLFHNRDLKEYHDLIANGVKTLRDTYYRLIEQPIRDAQAVELKIIKDLMPALEKLQKETGIKMYSKEDEAVGWVVEEKKQDGSRYSVEDLKRDFPEKWKDIMKVVDFYKDAVEKMYNEEITESRRIYGDVEYQNELRTAKLENDLKTKQSILEKRAQDLRARPNKDTQAGYSKAQKEVDLAQKKLDAQLEKNKKHVQTRREFTPHRENYFHHTNEVHFTRNAKAFWEMVKSGFSRSNNIPTELAGRTEFTRPRSTVQSFRWRQGQKNYSSSGFASLQHRIKEHANAMAFDSTVSYLRTVENAIEELDTDNKMNTYMSWFRRYVNNLAGKTNDLDRVMRDMTPDVATAILKAMNDRAKANSVYGNISSALVQSGNFPVGVALAVKNGGQSAVQDLIKGTAYYLNSIKQNGSAKDNSLFLNLRYYDIDLQDARPGANLNKFGSFMMQALDKVTSEQLWFTFYAQAERLNNPNPIAYADEMTDRAVQSRRPEDLPLSQQSEIIKMVAPFQVEVNNQWQVMKDLVKGSVKGDNKANNIAGLIALALVSAAMNVGFEKILGRKPLYDPIDAVVDVLGDEEIPLTELDSRLTARLVGETVGAMPYGQYLPGLVGMSEEEATELFGESDPSRYGVGNIGITALRRLLFAQTDEERQKALEDVIFTYGPNGWGKQLQRFYREGQDFGYVPKYVNGQWRMDPIHYTSSGGVAFTNDPTDVFDYMRGVIGGQYNTKAGKEYIESGFNKMGIESLKDPDGKTIPASKALQVRKQLEDLGVYDDVVQQIQDGYMTPAKAGLSEKVINMSPEEFNEKYNAMNQIAEGIGQSIAESYNMDNKQRDALESAIDIEADYKDGKKVTDSEALKTRKALEDAGLYEDVLDYIEKNGLDYTDVGLGKRVVGYDDQKFAEIYAQKIGGGN